MPTTEDEIKNFNVNYEEFENILADLFKDFYDKLDVSDVYSLASDEIIKSLKLYLKLNKDKLDDPVIGALKDNITYRLESNTWYPQYYSIKNEFLRSRAFMLLKESAKRSTIKNTMEESIELVKSKVKFFETLDSGKVIICNETDD